MKNIEQVVLQLYSKTTHLDPMVWEEVQQS